MTGDKDIVYPVFLECCQYASDAYWKTTFEDLAYGQTPYGTYISKGFLCCSYKDKEFSYKIEKIPAEKLYTDVHSLLTNKLGILSTREKNTQRRAFTEIEKDIRESRQTWASIRKKTVKDMLVENFVVEMQSAYALTTKQAKKLLSALFVSLMFKIIGTKDIHYDGTKITSIDGIGFRRKKMIFKRTVYDS
ncbi:hypothetical protein HN747_05370, partial [archaeon]|nr:hypothetical protein [archaeon]